MRSFLQKFVSPVAAAAVVLAAGACDSSPPTPQPPQANDDHFEIRSDDSLSVAGPGLLTNDVGDAVQVGSVNGSAANVGLPTATAESGTVTVQTNGAFQYARAAGFTGTDTFSYAASNAGGSDDANVSIFVTDPWTQLEAMPTAVSRAAGVFWNGRLYVIGGQAEGSGHAGLVHVYDVATAAWTVLPDAMPTPVSNHCVALLGDEAFVPGGFDGAAGVTATQVLDLASGTWRVEAAA
ncbi:MAG: Ig-like domain-containing protein, partial [Trueperaceae bacterium]